MPPGKRTPLYPIYATCGARLVDYAGWDLPLQFSGIGAEHRAVRTGAGLFDVSHMGRLRVTGRAASAFLRRVLTNDCARLAPGRVQYTLMCYPDGGCVDDLLVYMLDGEEFLLVVNAVNTDKDLAWLLANTTGYAVSLADVSSDHAQLALQGPGAASLLTSLTGSELADLPPYRFLPTVRAAGCSCLVSRTGYTGEDGFELYLAPENAVPLWQALLASGQAIPAGLGARDTLRLEAGLPLYGHEISPTISPVEAGLARFVALDKTEFVGRHALAAQVSSGPPRQLVGLELETKAVPRAGHPVLSDDRIVGAVTSGTLSPFSDRPIALALLELAATRADSRLTVEIHAKRLPAHLVALPFYRRRRRS